MLQDTSAIPDSEPLLSYLERRLLLEDIGRIGLTLGREIGSASLCATEPPVPLSPASTPPAATEFSPLERLRLLLTLWPAIQTALCALTRQVDTRLCQKTIPVSLSHSRGGPITTDRLARTPQGITAWQAIKNRTRKAPSPAPCDSRLLEARVCSTADTRANRFVVSLLLSLEKEARSLAILAAFCGEDRTSEQALAAADAARRSRNCAILREIGPLAPSEHQALRRGDPVLRRSPPYEALADLSHRLYAPLRFDWTDSPLLNLPALEAWRLYEIWCYFQVAAALRTNGWRAWEGEMIRWQTEGLRFVLQTGKASRLRFIRGTGDTQRERYFAIQRTANSFSAGPLSSESLELFYQPLFPSANQTTERLARKTPRLTSETAAEGLHHFSSRSHAMQPDIALLQRGRLYLLDPKYRDYTTGIEAPGASTDSEFLRQNTALLTDIDKMHAYRDAIIHRQRRAVAEAWCLFPGKAGASAVQIAYPTGDAQQPFGEAGIGALHLRPGCDHAALLQLLHRWLS